MWDLSIFTLGDRNTLGTPLSKRIVCTKAWRDSKNYDFGLWYEAWHNSAYWFELVCIAMYDSSFKSSWHFTSYFGIVQVGRWLNLWCKPISPLCDAYLQEVSLRLWSADVPITKPYELQDTEVDVMIWYTIWHNIIRWMAWFFWGV